MSLKAFHVVFIAISGLFCLAFAGWGVREYRQTQGAAALLSTALGGGGAAGLGFYMKWFLRKWTCEELC